MKTYRFTIQFPDGMRLNRTEWGKTRKSAFKTICGIYGEPGKDFVVLA